MDFRAALAAVGVPVSKQAVHNWLNGGGIADRHKPAVAEVLGLSVEDLVYAAAGQARPAILPSEQAA